MIDDFEYIFNLSGENSGLSRAADGFSKANMAMLTLTDHIFGSADATDAFDASCNTCKHFQREKFDRITQKPHIFGFPGYCMKLNRQCTGWQRGQYDGFAHADCYENRRTGQRPHEVKLVIGATHGE